MLKAALALGILVALSSVLSNQVHSSSSSETPAQENVAAIPPEDAAIIPESKPWSLFNTADFGPDYSLWMREAGSQPAAQVGVDLHGTGQPSGVAYLLVTSKTPDVKRVVCIVDHKVIYDVVDKIEGIARVPADQVVRAVATPGLTPEHSPEGEGLLVVRSYNNPATSSLLFIAGGTLHTFNPSDFRTIRLD